jgi:hypothetical protein
MTPEDDHLLGLGVIDGLSCGGLDCEKAKADER